MHYYTISIYSVNGDNDNGIPSCNCLDFEILQSATNQTTEIK